MEQRRQLASRRPVVHVVALLFVVGCGGSGGSSTCPQSTYPTATLCCEAVGPRDPITESFVCDESTRTWTCPGTESTTGCIVSGTGSGGASGGSVGSGGGGGVGGNVGSGGVGGGVGGAAGGGVGGLGGAGGLSGHSGANGSCGPANNGQGGSECGKTGITCCTNGACDPGLRCITGAICARQCSVDGGVSSCPSGGTCQSTSACCVGTGCAAVQVMVCL